MKDKHYPPTGKINEITTNDRTEGQAVGANDRRKRLNAPDIGLNRAKKGNRGAADGDCTGKEESAAHHVPRILRRTKQKGTA